MEEQKQSAEPTTTKPKSYNPFVSQVSEKPYAQMSVDADPSRFQSAIPQPEQVTNRINANEDVYKMLNGDGAPPNGGSGGNGSTSQSFNPAMNGMPNAEKKMGAEQLAKLIVDGYEQLNLFANRGLKISDKKIKKLVAEGEIDLGVQIPYDYGKTISAGEFIESVNEQNKDTFSVSKEFKKEVTPPLTRILEKRNAGLTDEQYVGFLFGKDMIVKTFIFFQVNKTLNEAIEVIKEYTQVAKQNGFTPNNPTETSRKEEPKTEYYPTQEEPSTPIRRMPEPNPHQDNFNFATNEAFVDSAVVRHQVPDDGKAALMRRKREDKQIQAAIEKYNPKPKPVNKDGGRVGKRGRKPKEYIPVMDEEQIAEALVLRETKDIDTDKIAGLD
jgi:hypothetical protein